MKWYGVHVIMAIGPVKGRMTTYPVYENILLIKAKSPRHAMTKARRIARHEERIDDKLTTNGRPAVRLFLGVRKAVEITSPPRYQRDEPLDGTEITYNYYEVNGRAALQRLATGKRVSLTYLT
jgi:hypothetical protein